MERKTKFWELIGLKLETGRKGRARKGVGVLLNDHLWEREREVRYVNSRIVVILFMNGECWNVTSVFVPGVERSWTERKYIFRRLSGV